MTGECIVWSVTGRYGASEPDRLIHLLDPRELDRRAGYRRARDRARFTVGAALLRLAVAATTGADPAAIHIDRTCPDCGRHHGRPEVAGGPHVSVSHSGDVVVVAVTAAGPVGIDVELHPDRFDDLVAIACDPSELRGIVDAASFSRVWTRKEAVLKALGVGLRRDPATVVVSAPTAPASLVRLGGETTPACSLTDLDLVPGHAAAVAVLTGLEIRCVVRDGRTLFPH